MEQLIMNWTNDGTAAKMPKLPENTEVKNFPNLPNALAAWQDIMVYLARDGQLDTSGDYYEKNMTQENNYNEDKCFFLLVHGQPAATITVICDHKKKNQGYIHMVACKPEFRGIGLGKVLNDIAVYTLKREGMESAYLTTDDWRIPAIKSYLRAGFTPNLTSEPDFQERWDKIYKLIGV